MASDNTELPQVSVIVPVYNAEKTLERSVRSLLNQKNLNIEIILVNDASTDATANLIRAIAGEHSAIVPIHLSRNVGAHEARLAGLKYARAPWIGFMDADDFARPPMFQTLLRTAQRENVDIVICASDRVDPSRKVISTKVQFPNAQRVDIDVFTKFCQFEFGTGALWNKLYRREIILPCCNLHFPWRQDTNEDMILNLSCFLRARSVFLLPEVLYEYVANPNSETGEMINNHARAYCKNFRAFAIALHVTPNLDEKSRTLIIDLYRRQLSFNDYCLPSCAELAVYEVELAEAEELVYRNAPSELAKLALRASPRAGKPIRKRLFRGVTIELSSGVARRLRDWQRRLSL